jgi:hypothetical protein
MSRFLDIAVGCAMLPVIVIRAIYDLIRGK